MVDVATLTVGESLDFERMYAFQIVDGRAFLVLPHEYTGGSQYGQIKVVDLETHDQLGGTLDADLLKGSIVGEHEVFLQRGVGSDSYLTAIEIASGRARDIRVVVGGKETLDLEPRLSAATVLSFVPVEGATLDSRGFVTLPISLLDPASGDLTVDAFTIGAP
jgi:hypothetical protein